MAYITDAQLKTEVAAILKLESSADLEAYFTTVVASANEDAYNAIRSRLLARGFTAAQVDQWDRRVEFNRKLGAYWTLVRSGNLKDSDLWVEKFNVEAELDDVLFTIDGEAVNPGSTTTRIGQGPLNTTADTFSLDTEW